ncbi:MAG: NAD(P)H-hydrate dehydratase [Methanomassiliicoccaceae archaeon]|nr:NAD(P)H-hydrate dehydratase [Methanomassiliicoccaceae archaeon]
MISRLESKIIDENCEALGVPIDTLMDNAGEALFEVLVNKFGEKRILIVCGVGNNGGDGMSCARRLGKKATVAMMFPPSEIKSAAARRQFETLPKKHVMFSDVSLDHYDVIVDCVLGVGARTLTDPLLRDYLKKLKSFKGQIVSADIPTGFGTKDAVTPDITVTFHDIKDGMTEANSGKIIVADIGIPREAIHCVGVGDMLRYPIPNADSHKGENGRLLVIGGGPYVGAPAMSAMAALRTGVDIVRVAVPKRCFVPVASMTPSFVMHELPDDILREIDVKHLLELSKKVDAVLIGPGLGTDDDTMAAVREFILRCDKPTVVDADAIVAIASMAVLSREVIVTPHKHEFEEFSGFALASCDLMSIAKKRNVTMILKGETDVIVSNDKKKINNSGTPAMTVGGTGDVLSGIVAGLLSKGMDKFNSACLGAFICGTAGEMAFKEFSYGLTATDVIDMIPKVLRDNLKG